MANPVLKTPDIVIEPPLRQAYDGPVIDPHLHFSGCLTPSFVASALHRSEEEVLPLMTMQPDDPHTLPSFLSKFRVFRQIAWTPELFRRACEVVAHRIAAMANCGWLRLSVGQYVACGLSPARCISDLQQTLDSICGPGAVRLLLGLQYEADGAWNIKIVKEVLSHANLHGLDFCGDETQADMSTVAPIVLACVRGGKVPFAHVGESISPERAVQRIEVLHSLGLRNICHGTRAFRNTRPIHLSRDTMDSCIRDTWFHMALTSNRLTGAVLDGHNHPAEALLGVGVLVTVGADDPVQCSCTTQDELRGLGLYCQQAAINAADHWDMYAP